MDMKWTEKVAFSCDWCNIRVDVENRGLLWDALERSVEGFNRNDLVALSKGQNFYKETLTYAPAGYSAITFSFCPCEDDLNGMVINYVDPEHPCSVRGILVSVSGDGCRYLQNLCDDGLKRFLSVCRSFPHRTTRFDVAMDLFDKDNPIVPLFQKFSQMAYEPEKGKDTIAIKGRINRCEGYCRRMPVWDFDLHAETDNVYIGDRTCAVGQVCVYNKKVEIRHGRLRKMAKSIYEDVGMTDNYWYRIEYRAKSLTRRPDLSLAEPALCAFLDQGEEASFYYLADRLFVFINLIYDFDSINKCPIVDIWTDFLEWMASYQNAHFVELPREGYFYVKPNFERLVRFYRRIASSLTYYEDLCSLIPSFRSEINNTGRRRRSDQRSKFAVIDSEIARFRSVREMESLEVS